MTSPGPSLRDEESFRGPASLPVLDRTLACEQGRSQPAHRSPHGALWFSRGQKVSVALVVAVFFGASMFVLMSSTAPSAARTYHSPIYIVGDSGFVGNDAVTGSGTLSDPYVISGYEIFSFTGPGILVQSTSAHLVIRDVHVNSTADGLLNPAIHLQDVSNVTIEGSLLNDTENGIIIAESDNVTISCVDIVDYSRWGVDVSYSRDISVMDSYLAGSDGILGSVVSEVVLTSNEICLASTGVMLTEVDNATVQDNSLWGCSTAMYLSTADTCRLVGNSANNSDYGLIMCWVYHSNISGNVIHEMAGTGIWSYDGSNNNTVFSNIISNCSTTGMVAEATMDCTVTYNVFRNNSDDFWMCSGGVWLRGCEGLLLHHNSFYDNVPLHAYDEGTDNRWNESYPIGGNYWDDYVGEDACSGPDQDVEGDPDGIGDTSYWLDGDTSDYYPLVDALNTNSRPVAAFTVTPMTGATGEEFSFDASSCADEEDLEEDLQVRWDWDGDGNWDTSFSTDKTVTHAYLLPGNYTIRMEVLDTGGLSDVTSATVEVTGTPIPEFTSLLVPVSMVMALFIIARRRR